MEDKRDMDEMRKTSRKISKELAKTFGLDKVLKLKFTAYSMNDSTWFYDSGDLSRVNGQRICDYCECKGDLNELRYHIMKTVEEVYGKDVNAQIDVSVSMWHHSYPRSWDGTLATRQRWDKFMQLRHALDEIECNKRKCCNCKHEEWYHCYDPDEFFSCEVHQCCLSDDDRHSVKRSRAKRCKEFSVSKSA